MPTRTPAQPLMLCVDGVDRPATPEEAAAYWAEIPGVIEQNNATEGA